MPSPFGDWELTSRPNCADVKFYLLCSQAQLIFDILHSQELPSLELRLLLVTLALSSPACLAQSLTHVREALLPFSCHNRCWFSFDNYATYLLPGSRFLVVFRTLQRVFWFNLSVSLHRTSAMQLSLTCHWLNKTANLMEELQGVPVVCGDCAKRRLLC